MKRRVLFGGLVLALAVTAGGWWLSQSAAASSVSLLEATGVVEVEEVSVAPEVGGRVIEVLVDEGDSVAAGDPLFRFDDEALQIQRRQVFTAGQSAQANAELALLTARQALADLNDNAAVITAQAELNLADARKALDDSMRHRSWQAKGNRASSETIDGVEAQLTLADETVSEAEDAVNRVSNLSTDDPKRAAAEAALYNARHARDKIKANLNWYTGSPTDFDQAILDAQVAVAQATVDRAQAEFDKVKIGPDPADLALAQAQVKSAEAALTAATAGMEAEVEAIDLQLEKFTVRAPTAGVVLNRSLNPGEVLQPGGAAMTIGRLDTLHVTVYLAEDRFGLVTPGEEAIVRVDTYPGVSFSGTVLRVADEAEFTPTNVQTREDRTRLVYAVVIDMENPDLALKPGMVADVEFLR